MPLPAQIITAPMASKQRDRIAPLCFTAVGRGGPPLRLAFGDCDEFTVSKGNESIEPQRVGAGPRAGLQWSAAEQ